MQQSITELKQRRNEILDAMEELDPVGCKVEIYELHGEINDIDRQIHAIDPSQV